MSCLSHLKTLACLVWVHEVCSWLVTFAEALIKQEYLYS